MTCEAVRMAQQKTKITELKYSSQNPVGLCKCKRRFDTIISHENELYISNYSLINQKIIQGQENVDFFSLSISHSDVL